jgi:hypothetical protein
MTPTEFMAEVDRLHVARDEEAIIALVAVHRRSVDDQLLPSDRGRLNGCLESIAMHIGFPRIMEIYEEVTGKRPLSILIPTDRTAG